MELNEGSGGGIAVTALVALTAVARVLYVWVRRERKEDSLYKIELDAHAQTRVELADERKLRRETEIELERLREEHSSDREDWYRMRGEDRKVMESLKDEVFTLRQEVKRLDRTLTNNGITRPVNNANKTN